MKLSKAMFTTSAMALALISSGAVTAHADTPKLSDHEVAIKVVRGDYSNGDERVTKLTAEGYTADKVQAEVNNILLGETPKAQTPAVETPAPQAEQAPAQPAPTPQPAYTGGIDLSQTTGSVDIHSLATYMVSNTPNSGGYSVAQWENIIYRESHGIVDVHNQGGSGAYGVFQLLGHGEYQGMTLGEQISMANTLPASAWAETAY